MKHRITLMVMGVVLCLAPLALGQGLDPGVPDTLSFGNATIGVGVSSPLPVRICNDSLVAAVDMGLEFFSLDSGAVRFDSVRFVGRLADPSVLQLRIVNRRKLDGAMPDSLLIALLSNVGEYLPSGNGAVMEFFFTGVQPGRVAVDTNTFWQAIDVHFNTPYSAEYAPVVLPGIIDVVPSSLPPVISLPAGLPVAVRANDPMEFSVGVQSPAGFPTELVLSSLNGWDDPTSVPLATPALNAEGQFSWTPGAADVGIWRATFLATDSSGMTAEAEAQIQVVSSEDFLRNLDAVETPDVPLAMSVSHGDFDNDGQWELLVAGLASYQLPAFALFTHAGGGDLNKELEWGFSSIDYNLSVGFVDDDEFLDAVLCHNSDLRVLRGGAGGLTPTDHTVVQKFSKRDAALVDFNGDEHLDYVSVSLLGGVVFLGRENSDFDAPYWFIQGDSILSLNSADFNDDGYDDLALGTTHGLKILLSEGQGNFVAGESYPQEFGSVDVEVTTRGADFNGDNRFDICLASPSKGGQYSDLYVYLGNADGTFEPILVRRVLGQIFAARPGDFNGDAILDIAYLNGAERYVAIAFGDGAGGFANELRFSVPKYVPHRLDCLDIDLDGDLDLVVASYFQGMTTNSSLYVYLNQSNPGSISQEYLEVRAANNVDIELRAPSGARLNRVSNTIASGELYMCDADRNDRLDIKAACRTIESGRYELIAVPRKNAPAGAPFSIEYTVGEQPFRLAIDMPSLGRYVFPMYPDGVSPVMPVQGSFLRGSMPSFTWPDGSETQFELARDLNFTQLVQTATVSRGSFTLTSALPETDSTPYFWRVRSDGAAADNVIYVFNAVASPTGVDDDDQGESLPIAYALDQNYPNPFNPVTSLSYSVPAAAPVKITVHNVLGQQVAVLVDRVQSAGTYSVLWDATDSRGRPVASGIYFYRMQSESFSATRKMVLLR